MLSSPIAPKRGRFGRRGSDWLLVGVIWATTAFASIPAHNTLANGWDTAAHAQLVLTNWIRTLAWIARGVLVVWTLGRAMSDT